jgi:hypothetical protein
LLSLPSDFRFVEWDVLATLELEADDEDGTDEDEDEEVDKEDEEEETDDADDEDDDKDEEEEEEDADVEEEVDTASAAVSLRFRKSDTSLWRLKAFTEGTVSALFPLRRALLSPLASVLAVTLDVWSMVFGGEGGVDAEPAALAEPAVCAARVPIVTDL